MRQRCATSVDIDAEMSVAEATADGPGPLNLKKALRSMPLDKADAALELIEKLTRNVVRRPAEPKFRLIKLSNPKISESLTEVPGAVNSLRGMGWVDGAADGEPTLELPIAVRLAFQVEVVKIIEAKDYYKKERENEKRGQKRAKLAAKDPEKRALKNQFEQDRQKQIADQAAKGPARASKARKLNDAPNIMRASDLGIGVSTGG